MAKHQYRKNQRRLNYRCRFLKGRSLNIALGILAGLSTLGLSSGALIQRSPSLAAMGEPVQGQEVITPVSASKTDIKSDAAPFNQPQIAPPPQSKHHNTIRRMGELRQGQQKWLEINLSTQRLIAWEGGKPVYAVIVSTGKPATPTYSGVYSIYRKQHPERMRGRGYDIPNVPHAMYYHRGYAIHGAYWHSRFGTPVSHGCTNVAPNHARWLYNWASVGTPVVVHR